MKPAGYTGPVGVGFTFHRGDKVIRIVGDYDQFEGSWPYEVVSVAGADVPPGGRRRIHDDRLRREFEPAGAVAS